MNRHRKHNAFHFSLCFSMKNQTHQNSGPFWGRSSGTTLSWKGCSGTPKDAPSWSHLFSSPGSSQRETDKEHGRFSHSSHKHFSLSAVQKTTGEEECIWSAGRIKVVLGRDWRREKKGSDYPPLDLKQGNRAAGLLC